MKSVSYVEYRDPTMSINKSNIRNYKKEIEICVLCWISWSNNVQRCSWISIDVYRYTEYKKLQKRNWNLCPTLNIVIQHCPTLLLDFYRRLSIHRIQKITKKKLKSVSYVEYRDPMTSIVIHCRPLSSSVVQRRSTSSNVLQHRPSMKS